ncbi:MAG: hypothetical protein R2717_09605 [Schumannella sp.]
MPTPGTATRSTPPAARCLGLRPRGGRRPGPTAFLGASLPDGWCFYKSTSYTTYYALPATEVDDPGTDVRAALEPAGWAFDPVDDGSPQWSWICLLPRSCRRGLLGWRRRRLDLHVSSAVTADDIDAYTIWYSSLFSSFGDWSEGDCNRDRELLVNSPGSSG